MTRLRIPEQILFLKKAMRVMKAHHAEHGEYPPLWHLLDIQFSGRTYHRSDPTTRPRPEDGARWKPPACHSTYVIEASGPAHVRIVALGPQGELQYQFDDQLERPQKVVGLAD